MENPEKEICGAVAVFQLNALRNCLAHKLTPADLNDKLRRFALAASGGHKEATDQILVEPKTQMVGAIEVMCGFFIGLANRDAPLTPPNRPLERAGMDGERPIEDTSAGRSTPGR